MLPGARRPTDHSLIVELLGQGLHFGEVCALQLIQALDLLLRSSAFLGLDSR